MSYTKVHFAKDQLFSSLKQSIWKDPCWYYNLCLALSPENSCKNWKETLTTRGRFGICSTVTLKLQEFWDGNLPRETGRGEGKGHSQVQELQSVKFNLVSPGGSKSPGKHLVLEILHGWYLKRISRYRPNSVCANSNPEWHTQGFERPAGTPQGLTS